MMFSKQGVQGQSYCVKKVLSSRSCMRIPQRTLERARRQVSFVAASPRPAHSSGLEDHSFRSEESLAELLTLDDSALRNHAATSEELLSLEFLTWLKSREQAAGDGDKEALFRLGGKLTALREGTDPLAAAQLLEAIREQGAAGDALRQDRSSESSEGALQLQIRQRTAELARRMAMDATSPAQLTKEQDEARDFSRELQARRASATAELIGRAPVEMDKARKGLNAAAAADRILEALLSIQDPEERLAMVPEAFVPPQEGVSQESASSDEEMIYTSPMRLLQAVALAMRRLEGNAGDNGEGFVFQPHGLVDRKDRKNALIDIKKAIFDVLEQ